MKVMAGEGVARGSGGLSKEAWSKWGGGRSCSSPTNAAQK